MTPTLFAATLSLGPPAELAPPPRLAEPDRVGRIIVEAGTITADRVILYQPPRPPAEVSRFGRVIIEGNTFTHDRLILDRLPFFPGRVIPPAVEFEKVERQLLVAFASRFDLDAGHWPTVRLVPTDLDSAFRDVVVRFPERPVKAGPVPFWLRWTPLSRPKPHGSSLLLGAFLPPAVHLGGRPVVE